VKLEDLKPQLTLRGVLPDVAVTVVNVQWFGSDALELTYKDPGGRVGNVLLYRDDEPRAELLERGRPCRRSRRALGSEGRCGYLARPLLAPASLNRCAVSTPGRVLDATRSKRTIR